MTQRRALVVGADPQVEALVRRTLEPAGWTVGKAADNEAALKLVEVSAFGLIVTDPETRSKDDIELLRKIRRIHPHTRVVILTDETTPVDVLAAIREHAFSLFSKPLSLDSLGSIIMQVTEEPCWDDGIELVSATPRWIRLRARCDIKTADRLLQYFREIMILPEPERESVGTALRELLLNAIEHGAKFDPEKYVEISYLRTEHAVACRIKDPGEGFSLDEIPHAAIMNPDDDPIRHVAIREESNLRPGGFGVLMAQSIVDEMFYNEQGNEVVLIKRLERRPAAS